MKGLEFSNKLESKLMSLNLDQNIEESNKITSSLTKACEIIPRIPRRKKIFLWDNNPELKILIQERNKQKRKKNE